MPHPPNRGLKPSQWAKSTLHGAASADFETYHKLTMIALLAANHLLANHQQHPARQRLNRPSKNAAKDQKLAERTAVPMEHVQQPEYAIYQSAHGPAQPHASNSKLPNYQLPAPMPTCSHPSLTSTPFPPPPPPPPSSYPPLPPPYHAYAQSTPLNMHKQRPSADSTNPGTRTVQGSAADAWARSRPVRVVNYGYGYGYRDGERVEVKNERKRERRIRWGGVRAYEYPGEEAEKK